MFPTAQVVFDRRFTHAVQVADIESQTEGGVVHPREQFFEFRHGVDEHARLGFEGEANPFAGGMAAQHVAAIDQSPPEILRDFIGIRCSGPETDDRYFEFGGNVNRTEQEVQPLFALVLETENQRGPVLAVGVE